MVPLAILTLIGLFLLWPRGGSPIGSQIEFAPGASQVIGEISSIGATDASRQTPVKMLVDGVEVGLHVPYEYVKNGLDVGDKVKAIFSPGLVDTDTPYVFVDFVRTIPVWILVTLYVLVVAVVAG